MVPLLDWGTLSPEGQVLMQNGETRFEVPGSVCIAQGTFKEATDHGPITTVSIACNSNIPTVSLI